MEACASDSRDFVSSWTRDPTAREDDLVVARVQFRSVTRVARWRDARASRRRAVENETEREDLGILDDDDDVGAWNVGGHTSPDGVGDADDRARHKRGRPQSASYARPQSACPPQTFRACTRVRPQSAKVSRRVDGLLSPSQDFAWMPKAVKQSKWTEMLHSGPCFQEPNLQRLEAETYALLEQVLRGPVTRRRPQPTRGDREDTDSHSVGTKKKKKETKPSQARSAGPAVGSGLQVARNNKKVTAQASTSVTAASSSHGTQRGKTLTTTTRYLGSARGASIDRHTVIEKTKVRSKSTARSGKKKKVAVELSEKERKKRDAEAEASAKVMREMGWLDDLDLSDQGGESEVDPPPAKNRSKTNERKKKLKHCGSSLGKRENVPETTSSAEIVRHRPVNHVHCSSSPLDEGVHGTSVFCESTEIANQALSDVSPRNENEDEASISESRQCALLSQCTPTRSSGLGGETSSVLLARADQVDNDKPLSPEEMSDTMATSSRGIDNENMSSIEGAGVLELSSSVCDASSATLCGEMKTLFILPDTCTTPVGSLEIKQCAPDACIPPDFGVTFNGENQLQLQDMRAPNAVVEGFKSTAAHNDERNHVHERELFVAIEGVGEQYAREVSLRSNSPDSSPVDPSPVVERWNAMCAPQEILPCDSTVTQAGSAYCSSQPIIVPKGELKDVESSQDVHTEQLSQRSQVSGESLSSQNFGERPSILFGERTDEVFVKDEEHEHSSTKDVVVIPDHEIVLPMYELVTDEVVPDEYQEEVFEDDIHFDGFGVHKTPKPFRVPACSEGISLATRTSHDEDESYVLAETVLAVVCFDSCNLAEAEVYPESSNTGINVNVDSSREELLKPRRSNSPPETARAAELILRQYRAFCNRRIILEQAQFLARKKRRAERRKSHDHRSQTDFVGEAICGERAVSAGDAESSVPNCFSHQIVQREKVALGIGLVELPPPVGESDDANATRDVMPVSRDDTAGQNPLHTMHHSDSQYDLVPLDGVSVIEEHQEANSSVANELEDDHNGDEGEGGACLDAIELLTLLGNSDVESIPTIENRGKASHQQEDAVGAMTTLSASVTDTDAVLREFNTDLDAKCHEEVEKVIVNGGSEYTRASDSDHASLVDMASHPMLLDGPHVYASCEGFAGTEGSDQNDSLCYSQEFSRRSDCVKGERNPQSAEGSDTVVADVYVSDSILENLLSLPPPCDQPKHAADDLTPHNLPAQAAALDSDGDVSNLSDLHEIDPAGPEHVSDTPAEAYEYGDEGVPCNKELMQGLSAVQNTTIGPSHNDSDLYSLQAPVGEETLEHCVDGNENELGSPALVVEKGIINCALRQSRAAVQIQRTWKRSATQRGNSVPGTCGYVACTEVEEAVDGESRSEAITALSEAPLAVSLSVPGSDTGLCVACEVEEEKCEGIRATPPESVAADNKSFAVGCEGHELESELECQAATVSMPDEFGVKDCTTDKDLECDAINQSVHIYEEGSPHDESPLDCDVEHERPVDTNVIEASRRRQEAAACCIQCQYRHHVFRRNLLDQLAFFMRQHRRESRKKSRRLSGELVHRVSEDPSVEFAGSAKPLQEPLTAQPGQISPASDCASRSQPDAATPNVRVSSDPISLLAPTESAATCGEVTAPFEQLSAGLVLDQVSEAEDTGRSPSEPPATKSSPTWERYMDSGANKSFYYSPEKQLSRWDRPSDGDVVDRTLEYATSAQTIEDSGGRANASETLMLTDAQDRWERYKDSATNKTFYFHRARQVSQWERPDDGCVIDTVGDVVSSGSEPQSDRWRQAQATVLESFGGWDRCLCAQSADEFYYHTDRDVFADGNATPEEFAAAKARLLAAETEPDGDSSDARWTLRRNRSLRGDRRGEWQAFVDTETHQTFYYNTVSGESSWDKPAAFSEAPSVAGSYEWVMYVDPLTAQPYYVNLVTNATCWDRPADFDEAVSTQDLARLRGIGEQREELAVGTEGAVAGDDVAATAVEGDEEPDEYVISIQDDQDAAEWLTL